jgi:hypothetical protein
MRGKREYLDSYLGSWYSQNKLSSNILIAFGSKRLHPSYWIRSNRRQLMILSASLIANPWFITKSSPFVLCFWHQRCIQYRSDLLRVQKIQIYLLYLRLHKTWSIHRIAGSSSYFSVIASSKLITYFWAFYLHLRTYREVFVAEDKLI